MSIYPNYHYDLGPLRGYEDTYLYGDQALLANVEVNIPVKDRPPLWGWGKLQSTAVTAFADIAGVFAQGRPRNLWPLNDPSLMEANGSLFMGTGVGLKTSGILLQVAWKTDLRSVSSPAVNLLAVASTF